MSRSLFALSDALHLHKTSFPVVIKSSSGLTVKLSLSLHSFNCCAKKKKNSNKKFERLSLRPRRSSKQLYESLKMIDVKYPRSIHFNFLQSGERNGTPSRRSKSEGPPLANGRCVNALDNVVSDVKQIKEKVFSLSLIFYAECWMFVFIINNLHPLTHTPHTHNSHSDT